MTTAWTERNGMDAEQHRLETLLTLRDWLRYAVSRFNAAGLVYGHGTANALDEAAFLILTALHLPIDQLEPWLDARLLWPEREAVARLIDLRIATRKPAPYLVNAAWIGPHRFYVDERVIVPRSYIGELLVADGREAFFAEGSPVRRVLDLCTGGGSLAIIAAHVLPEATVDAVDISTDALAVARRNVEEHGLSDRVSVIESDLFAAVEGRSYDLILSNPPYVTDAAVAAFPPEYGAEPRLAHAGGPDGLDIARRIITEAGRHLEPDGVLVVEVGQARAALERAFPHMSFLWHDTAESEGEVFSLSAGALAVELPAPGSRAPRRGHARSSRSWSGRKAQ
jgi:ribosomal protein L3 glutamine methyltransferase